MYSNIPVFYPISDKCIQISQYSIQYQKNIFKYPRILINANLQIFLDNIELGREIGNLEYLILMSNVETFKGIEILPHTQMY